MPYNSPMKKKGSSCMQMKDHKGKPSGLMMEGSAMHMSMLHQEKTKKVEEAKAKKLDKKQEIQEKKDLLTEMPIDNRGIGQMSPYKIDHEGSAMKMGHESPAKFTGMSGGSALHTNHDKDERSGEAKPFMDPGAPEGFTADAPDYGEAASKRFFKTQDIVNKAVQTLEDIEGGKTPYTGYANAASTVKQALLGDKARKDRLTTEQLKSMAKTNPVGARERISQNISRAKLGDARSQFDKSYNPFK